MKLKMSLLCITLGPSRKLKVHNKYELKEVYKYQVKLVVNK